MCQTVSSVNTIDHVASVMKLIQTLERHIMTKHKNLLDAQNSSVLPRYRKIYAKKLCSSQIKKDINFFLLKLDESEQQRVE